MSRLMRIARSVFRFSHDPGYRGTNIHKIAYFFWNRNFKRMASVVTSFNHILSGTAIGPGAKIHRTAEIVHGGVFIGETAEIGPNCKIMQNVTIGAKFKDINSNKRLHAILEENVVVCAGAVILGAVTIGRDSVIGPNSVVTRSMPPYSLAVGNPAKIHKKNTQLNEQKC
ncbi:serine O-acetyltransferase [Cohnella endophytica]|uniref:Serine acetyltransferase n=1 Tax=Cohnella endophytica TaxID=2419778 RepID=A0A494Y4G1_9BACL|nr:serine O-acetyltransferase [Cohnella endophytica]RKP55421.1 serine O-acetyltransferase [Cohnella endophytica]